MVQNALERSGACTCVLNICHCPNDLLQRQSRTLRTCSLSVWRASEFAAPLSVHAHESLRVCSAKVPTKFETVRLVPSLEDEEKSRSLSS